MNYKETLNYLYAQLPMYHRIGPAAFKKDLTNTLALLEHLGDPHQKFPTIHVGGTNGKGSVSHMLSAALQSAGLKTGLYISPHYKDFRERIKIDGRLIERKKVVAFIEQNRPAIEAIQPSFFELCVAMAFDHFAREKVDIAVVEVGLGGRLDSTNVLAPLLSVITNISFDHQSMLGDTLEKIAFEKAGIIKPLTPVVIGESRAETRQVFLKKAAETGSEILFAEKIFEARKVSTDWHSTVYETRALKPAKKFAVKLDAAGPFQEKNLATVLTAVEVLGRTDFGRKVGVDRLRKASLTGLENLRRLTKFQGRWQVLARDPLVLADSAHNEAGLRSIFSEIEKGGFERLHIVTGFVNDKELEPVLALFPQRARYYFSKANIPRGLDAQVLTEKAAGFGLRGRAYSSVKNAFKAAHRAAGPGDLVLVCGSIFVVAEVI